MQTHRVESFEKLAATLPVDVVEFLNKVGIVGDKSLHSAFQAVQKKGLDVNDLNRARAATRPESVHSKTGLFLAIISGDSFAHQPKVERREVIYFDMPAELDEKDRY